MFFEESLKMRKVLKSLKRLRSNVICLTTWTFYDSYSKFLNLVAVWRVWIPAGLYCIYLAFIREGWIRLRLLSTSCILSCKDGNSNKNVDWKINFYLLK